MQERDRLAGQLSSFFDNPSKYMQQRAKQVMFDIMANWMQQVEQTSPRLQGIYRRGSSGRTRLALDLRSMR